MQPYVFTHRNNGYHKMFQSPVAHPVGCTFRLGMTFRRGNGLPLRLRCHLRCTSGNLLARLATLGRLRISQLSRCLYEVHYTYNIALRYIRTGSSWMTVFYHRSALQRDARAVTPTCTPGTTLCIISAHPRDPAAGEDPDRGVRNPVSGASRDHIRIATWRTGGLQQEFSIASVRGRCTCTWSRGSNSDKHVRWLARFGGSSVIRGLQTSQAQGRIWTYHTDDERWVCANFEV